MPDELTASMVERRSKLWLDDLASQYRRYVATSMKKFFREQERLIMELNAVPDGGTAYKDAHKGFVETSSGRLFDVNAENPQFDITDIAHSLSLTTRWNGQCRKFYSVAEHSIMVSELMEKLKLGDPMEGLLHDATEAYLSDVPSPLKQFLPDWQSLDKGLEGKLRKWADIGDKTQGCKQADWIALFIEAIALMPSKGLGPQWADPAGFRPSAEKLLNIFPVKCLTPRQAKTAFMKRYKELKRRKSAEEYRKRWEAITGPAVSPPSPDPGSGESPGSSPVEATPV